MKFRFIKNNFARLAIAAVISLASFQNASADTGEIVLSKGLVRLSTIKKEGIVVISIAGKKKSVPVFAKKEGYRNTFNAICVDDTWYKLRSSDIKSVSFASDEESVSVMYGDVGGVNVRTVFSIGKTKRRDNFDMVRITTIVENKSPAEHYISFRSVYDTYLGEKKSWHFTSPKEDKISCETIFKNFADEGWIISGESKEAVRISFTGEGVTTPSYAAVCNKDIASIATSEGFFIAKRSFNSVVSYNDSAAVLFWNEQKLNAGKELKIVTDVSVSDTGFKYEDYTFEKTTEVETKEEKEFNDSPYIPVIPVSSVPAEPVEQAQEESEGKIGVTDNPQPAENQVQPEASSVRPENLTYDYVRSILEKIDSLEQTGTEANRQEIMQLQKEADAIIQMLRSEH